MKIKALSPGVLRQDRKKSWYQKFEWSQEIYWWAADKWRYVRRFFFARFNVVKMENLKRTEWRDSDSIMFHAVFQILKDYVEIELAHMHNMSRTGRHPKRDPEAGLAQLEWEIQLGDDALDQSLAAKNVRELYLWYTVDREERVDPFEIVPEYDRKFVKTENGVMKMDYPEWYTRALSVASRAEAEQYEEDTIAMQHLCGMREMMWT